MATVTQQVKASIQNLPGGGVIVQDDLSGEGKSFESGAAALAAFQVPANSEASRDILFKLLVAWNQVNGSPVGTVNGKTITITFTTGQNPTIAVT